MPLYVRDAEVSEMAGELQRLLKVPSKTEAVRLALRHEIERTRKKEPLAERIRKARAILDTIGPGDPSFDEKAYMDEMWGDI